MLEALSLHCRGVMCWREEVRWSVAENRFAERHARLYVQILGDVFCLRAFGQFITIQRRVRDSHHVCHDME